MVEQTMEDDSDIIETVIEFAPETVDVYIVEAVVIDTDGKNVPAGDRFRDWFTAIVTDSEEAERRFADHLDTEGFELPAESEPEVHNVETLAEYEALVGEQTPFGEHENLEIGSDHADG